MTKAGPEAGHTFRIRLQVRSSTSVGDGPKTDAADFDHCDSCGWTQTTEEG